ncbi:hypothetical protein DRN98_08540, partial [Methanosarcinales archaeon]
LKEFPKAKIVVDVKMSDCIIKKIEELGGIPVTFKTGHANIKKKMRETGAVFGAEASAHMYPSWFGRNGFFDDSIQASLLLLLALKEVNWNAEKLVNKLPSWHFSPDIRPPYHEFLLSEYKGNLKIIKKVVEKMLIKFARERSFDYSDIDGIKVFFKDKGWALVRSSGTEAVLSTRVDAKLEEDFNWIAKEIYTFLIREKIANFFAEEYDNKEYFEKRIKPLFDGGKKEVIRDLSSAFKVIIESEEKREIEKIQIIASLKEAVRQNNPLAIQTTEKLSPFLEAFIKSRKDSSHLKFEVIRVLGAVAEKGNLSALKALESIIKSQVDGNLKEVAIVEVKKALVGGNLLSAQVLEELIKSEQIDDYLKSWCISNLIIAVDEDSHLAVQVIEELIPYFKANIKSQKSDELKEKIIIALREAAKQSSSLAVQAIEDLIPSLEAIIKSKKNSNFLKTVTFEALVVAAIKKSFAAVQSLEVLIKSEKVNDYVKGCAIKSLYDAAYLEDSHPLIQTLKRLIPFLERLIRSGGVSDDLKKRCIWALKNFVVQQRSSLALQILMNIIIEPEGINDNVMDEVLKTLCALSSSLSIQGPVVELGSICREALSLEEILAEAGGKTSCFKLISRSLVYDLGEKKILVIKFLKAGENPSFLLREAFWMKHLEKLQKKGYFKGIRFDIPQPLEFSGSYVVKIRNIPIRIPKKLLHPENYALCFIASEDYFLYPNEILPEKRLSVAEFKEVILRASYLFGYLTSLGIIHTDIIPLFHNRPERRGYHYWEG